MNKFLKTGGFLVFYCLLFSCNEEEIVIDKTEMSISSVPLATELRYAPFKLFTAFNSSYGPAVYEAGKTNLPGSKVYQGSTYWKLVGITKGDFNGDNNEEIIVAFNSSNGPALYKGDGSSIGTKIYQGSSYWTIAGITSGDFDGDGKDELISGFNSSNGPALYKGDATSVGSRFYQGSNYWSVSALTADDFNRDGADQLVVGFNSSNGPALYKSDATSVGSRFYQGPRTTEVTALTTFQVHIPGRHGPENEIKLLSGFNTSNGSVLYKGDVFSIGELLYQGTSSSEITCLEKGIIAGEAYVGLNTANGPVIYGMEYGVINESLELYSGSTFWSIKGILAKSE